MCDILLSTSAFNFNLRHFTEAHPEWGQMDAALARWLAGDSAAELGGAVQQTGDVVGRPTTRLSHALGRAVQVDSIKARVESAPGFSS
jgi:hypothetical protein